MKAIYSILAFTLILMVALTGCESNNPFEANTGEEIEGVGKAALPSVAIERVMAVQNQHTRALMGISGVVGTATGLGPDGRPSVLVLTRAPGVAGIPRNLNGVPVVVKVTGEIRALKKPDNTGKPPKEPVDPVDPTARFERPVQIGVSTGHPDITAGTIACRVKDSEGNVYALSNNHVYANSNEASRGDAVIQPGTFDGGSSPADDIGTLSDFEPIDFDGGENTIDAAIALSTVNNLDNTTPSDGYGAPKSATVAARIRQKVIKYGRTTGLTKGKVYAVNATVNVGYDSGVALFVNQIIITPGGFSAGGDSGSLVVSSERGTENRQPVGLLFAGSSTVTIANPINLVLDRFEITIDGE